MSAIVRAVKFLVPHFSKIRRAGSNEACPAGYAPPNAPDRAAVYWQTNEYAHTTRRRAFKWLGVEWFSLPYREGLESYFFPAEDLCDLVSEMQAAGLVPPLGRDSTIFEPGCNVGRNLFWLRRRFGSRMVGMDISPDAIELAKRKFWKREDRVEFLVDDVLKTRYFDSIPDDHFDLAFTRWHLIHIAKCPEKLAYVRHLKRVARTLLVLEPTRPDLQGQTCFYRDGRYCLSWDDWAGEYGLRRFEPRTQIKESEQVFFATKIHP